MLKQENSFRQLVLQLCYAFNKQLQYICLAQSENRYNSENCPAQSKNSHFVVQYQYSSRIAQGILAAYRTGKSLCAKWESLGQSGNRLSHLTRVTGLNFKIRNLYFDNITTFSNMECFRLLQIQKTSCIVKVWKIDLKLCTCFTE